MAQQGNSDDLVTLQELVVSNAYEIAALMAMLERRGILKRAEVLEEIARLRRTATNTQGTRRRSS